MPLLSVACFLLLPPQISIDMYSAVLAKHCDVRWQPLTTAVGDPTAQVPHNAQHMLYLQPSWKAVFRRVALSILVPR